MKSSAKLKRMNDEQAMEFAIENHQDRMCSLCELHIIGGSSCSSTFLCEGRYCDRAVDYLFDELIDNAEADEEEYIEKYKPILINKLI